MCFVCFGKIGFLTRAFFAVRQREQQHETRHKGTVLRKMRLHDRAVFIVMDALLQVGQPRNKHLLCLVIELQAKRVFSVYCGYAPIKGKRLQAGWDNEYMQQLLGN